MKTIMSVGQQRKTARVHHADLHIVQIVDLSCSREHVLDARRLWTFDVDDGETIVARGDIRVRARCVHVARVFQWDHCARDRHRPIERRHVEHFEALPVRNKRIAELHRDAPRIVQVRRADLGCHLRLFRIVDVDNDEAPRSQHVHVMTGEDDAACAGEHAVRIERERARQEVV
jgi:hypothetical protein